MKNQVFLQKVKSETIFSCLDVFHFKKVSSCFKTTAVALLRWVVENEETPAVSVTSLRHSVTASHLIEAAST